MSRRKVPYLEQEVGDFLHADRPCRLRVNQFKNVSELTTLLLVQTAQLTRDNLSEGERVLGCVPRHAVYYLLKFKFDAH